MAAPSYGGASNVTAPMLGSLGNTAFEPGSMTAQVEKNPFSPYFGEPMREFKMNPYWKYGRENLALPDAYTGSIPYMTQLMIHMIQDEDLWPTRVVLPIRITESEQEIAWDEVIFDNHLLQPVPEEGVSRLLTQQKNERRDHYIRYGIALILEHGFMKTPKGQTQYRMNLMQIRNATLETMYFGVMEALLKSKQFSQAWTRTYGQQARSGASLRGYLGDEIDRYMIVQKTEHGFDILDNKAKKFMRGNGITPDTWILPEGTASYLAMVRPENRDYILKGQAGLDNYNSALNDANYKGIRQIAANSCQVFESKSFEIPGAPDLVDPLVRTVAVGEYNTMLDTVSDVVAPCDYKSFMRDIFVYNEARDDFSRITLKQALKACCRFNNEGSLYFPPQFMSSDQDTFMNMGRPVYVFGDMSKASLSNETLRKLAESVVSKFKCQHKDGNNAYNLDNVVEVYANPNDPYTNEFQDFFNHVYRTFPTSRLFDTDYRPTWYTTAAGRNGFPNAGTADAFYYNTIADGIPNRGPMWQYPNALPQVQDALDFFEVSTPATFTFADITDEVIHKKVNKIISSSDKAKPQEVTANGQTIDKFMFLLRRFNNRDRNGSRQKFAYDVLKAMSDVKDIAEKASPSWTKHFAFAMHLGLLNIAHAAGNRNDVAAAQQGVLDAFAIRNGVPVHENELKGDVAGVDALIHARGRFLSGAPPGANPNPTPAQFLPTNARIGAYTIPDMNRQYGSSMDEEEEGEDMTGSRFGAVRTRRTKTGAEYDRAGAFDTDAPNAIDRTPRTQAMADRWDDMYETYKDDKMMRAVILTFLHTPVSDKALNILIEKDIYFPFDFLLFRPRIRHRMATGILCKAGAETGETLIGHADFQLADDVVRKMHYGHFTLYSKSIVYKSDNVYLAENIVSTAYVGGNDVSMNTLDSLREDGERKSMYVALVPASDNAGDDPVATNGAYYNPMDVTGKFATNIPHLANLDDEIGNSNRYLHYPGATFYSHVWQFNNSAQRLMNDYVPAEVNSDNTVVFQGHQTSYNPAAGNFSYTTVNTGHFGERVYPGCGKVRRLAGSKFLEPVSYTSAFGATKSVVTVGV